MWQTKLGRCIYISPSGYKIYQNYFYRWLTLGSEALQTVINRHDPKKPVLAYLSILSMMFRQFPNDCCLLGLGGAGFIQLFDLYAPTSHLMVVECSEEVIDIAKQYFMLRHVHHINIIQQNAKDFVQHHEVQYPHLIIDIHNAHHFPDECHHEEFFSLCKKMLTPEGFLAINLANTKEHRSIFQLIKKQFNYNTLVIPLRKTGNMIIVATKNPNREVFLKQISLCSELKRIIWTDSWGYVAELKKRIKITGMATVS